MGAARLARPATPAGRANAARSAIRPALRAKSAGAIGHAGPRVRRTQHDRLVGLALTYLFSRWGAPHDRTWADLLGGFAPQYGGNVSQAAVALGISRSRP